MSGLKRWVRSQIQTAQETLHCIRVLGPRMGLRYLKIQRACRQNPGLIEDWASECQAQAMCEKDPQTKAILQDWACRLRAHLRQHLGAQS